jgi:hypothetical protein
MYWIPIVAVAILCVIGVAWSPVFALVLFVPALLTFFVFVGFSRRADETEPGAAVQEPASSSPGHDTTRTEGIWGERQT